MNTPLRRQISPGSSYWSKFVVCKSRAPRFQRGALLCFLKGIKANQVA